MSENQRVEKFPLWVRVLFLFFCGTAIVAFLLPSYNSNDAIVVVEEQIKALKDHHISEAYYEYTSKKFQNTTSLPQFREFLKSYPALSGNHSYQLELAETEREHAYVIGHMVSQDFDEMKAEWELVQEDGEWKVAALALTEIQGADEEQLSVQEIVDFAEKQLRLLKDRDFVEAYYGFTSKDFQNETPLSDFETFVNDNQIFLNYRSLNVENGRIENDRGYVVFSLEGPKGTYLLEYILSRELNDWKVFGLHLTLPSEVAVESAETNPEALVPPVREFLNALASLQPGKAYRLTSREFQNSTTFESFKEFVDAFPALSKRELADIKSGKVENGTGLLFVNLHDRNGITALEFRLGFFEGEWIIWGVEVLNSPRRANDSEGVLNEEKLHLSEYLFNLLRQQIVYLAHQDIDEAYDQLMSANYRKNHSIDQFEEFFQQFPIFLDHRSSYFNRFLRDNDQAVLRGYITTFHGDVFPVRFDFIEEEEGWKIDLMAMLEKHDPIAEAEEVFDKPADDYPPKPLELSSIVMGTEVSDKGVVKKPVQVLEPDVNLVFFNIQITNGQPQTLVTLFIEHVDSGSSAPPLSTMLQKKGDSAISFSYAAPRGGWPPGDYIAKITTTTGQEALFKFTVNSESSQKMKTN